MEGGLNLSIEEVVAKARDYESRESKGVERGHQQYITASGIFSKLLLTVLEIATLWQTRALYAGLIRFLLTYVNSELCGKADMSCVER